MPTTWRRLFGVFAVLLLIAGCAQDDGEEASGSPSPPAEEGVIEVRAGVNDPQDPTIAVTEFLPETVKVESGATVRWTVAGPEPHSVTFFPSDQTPPPPHEAEPLFAPTQHEGPFDGTSLANSGLGPMGPEPLVFELDFEQAGTYNYVCVIHPLMTGVVQVVEEDEPADTQQQVTERGDAELEEWLAEGRAAKQALLEEEPRTEMSGGNRVLYVEMGTTTEHTDILAFAPVGPEIEAGDSVVFVNNSMAPHTATFQGEGELPEDITGPEAQAPAPGGSPQTLTADGYFNTGWLPPDAPPGAGPPEQARSFRFDVPDAGEYAFVCLLHAPSGMAGTLTAT